VTAPAATSASPAGVWEDFVDIFYAPSTVFERRRSGQFGLALLILTVLSVVIYFATRGGMEAVMDAEFQRRTAEMAAKNPQAVQAMEKMRGTMEKIGWVFALIGTPIGVFIMGILLWIGGKLVGSVASIGAAVMVATYAMVPRLVLSLLAGVQGLLMDPNSITSRYSVTASLARFLDPNTTNPTLLKIAGQIDPFAIWSAVLLAIGLRVVGRVSTGKAAAIAGVVWLCMAFLG
jgi:hypothetical protein